MPFDVAKLQKETRRPVLIAWAKEAGVEVNPVDNVVTLKEKLMATTKSAPAKPATPAKPAAPVRPGAPAAPAELRTLAAAPVRPGAPPKPAAAPVRPGAPPKPAAAPVAAVAYVVMSDFDTFVKQVTDAFEAQTQAVEAAVARIDALELLSAGFGPHVKRGADGLVEVDLDAADARDLREWSYMFGFDFYNETPEKVRAELKKARAKKDFDGWVVVNELPVPGEAPAAVEEPAGEPQEQEITLEDIDKMNWSTLTEFAGQYEIDFSDISKPPQPKVLRNRIKEFIVANSGEPEAETEAEEAMAVGTNVNVEHEGVSYPGVYQGPDENDADNSLVSWEGETDMVSVPTASITAR